MKHLLTMLSLICLVHPAHADNLGFDGKIVEPDCDAMSSWFDCRKIDTAPAAARRGYEYIHHTSKTLGPHGNKKFADGTPYATTTIACSSCHFTGGHVPFGTPMYQSPDKFAGKPYFRPLNYQRDLKDSIVDCMRNCMNTSKTLSKDDPVMNDMVAYIQWLSAGVSDPAMKGAGWVNLPGHGLPELDPDVMRMSASPSYGNTLYRSYCATCHDKDGAGKGEYRRGEGRPRVPALWGANAYSRGAAFYNTPVLAGYIRKFMPNSELKDARMALQARSEEAESLRRRFHAFESGEAMVAMGRCLFQAEAQVARTTELEVRLKAQEQKLGQLRAEKVRLARELDEASAERDALERLWVVDAKPRDASCSGACDSCDRRLHGRCVLCVGGRTPLLPQYRQLAERLIHHDGGEEEALARLAEGRADIRSQT